MDITELRNKTAAARASKEEVEDNEFNTSLLRKNLDTLIQKAASKGKSELSLNFYCIKEIVLGERYGGPTIEAAIRHYSAEGFSVRKEYLLSSNDYSNESLIISWM